MTLTLFIDQLNWPTDRHDLCRGLFNAYMCTPFVHLQKMNKTTKQMDIIKRSPSHLAQLVFLFDDTYHKLYRVVIIQLMYYQLFTLNTISNLNRYKTAQYSLNKRQKITCAINDHEFVQKTNKEFDMNKINMFWNDIFYVKCISRIIVVING